MQYWQTLQICYCLNVIVKPIYVMILVAPKLRIQAIHKINSGPWG